MAVLVSACILVSYANARKLVRLSDGTLYCVYLRSPNGAWQVYVKKSIDNGSTWTDETRISTYDGMSDYNQFPPSIAVDSSNHLHVVWYGKATGFTIGAQIWYNKYDGSWAGPVRISDYAVMQLCSQRYPSIAVDGSDNLHVVWDGMASGFTAENQIWYNKYDGSWAGPVRISTGAGMELYEQSFAGIAIDSNGYLHVVWSGKADEIFAYNQVRYNKYTTSWAGPVRISDYDGMHIRHQGVPSIAVDSNDYIHVVWDGEATGFIYDRIWYNKYDGSWAGPVGISTYAGMIINEQRHPSIAVDASNAVHVLWYGKATGYIDFEKIWRAKYVTSWGTPELLQDTESDLLHPNIRWSRYPSSNIPAAGVDYVFFDGTNIYWDEKDRPFVSAPTVTTNPATAVEEETAIGNGNITNIGGENCDKRGICWNTTGNPTIADNKSEETDSFGTGVFSRPITGLSPGTKYYVKAYAHNSAGYGYGSEESFTTKPNAPSNLACVGQSSSQIDVNWIKGTGATKTMVRRKIGSYPSDVTDGDQAYYGTGNSFNDTSLVRATHYYYRAWSWVEGGDIWSDDYAEDNEWTLIGAPAVTTNAATGLAAVSATLNGKLDDDGGEACECGFEWGLSIGYGTTTPPQSKTTGEVFSQVIGGLFPGTTYHFRAFATNSIGTSYGADESFATALVISRAHALAREEL